MLSCCKLLGAGIFCPYNCLRRSGHSSLGNLQQDKCYSLFCHFLTLFEWKNIIPLKTRTLRMFFPVYFHAIGNILNFRKSNSIQSVK